MCRVLFPVLWYSSTRAGRSGMHLSSQWDFVTLLSFWLLCSDSLTFVYILRVTCTDPFIPLVLTSKPIMTDGSLLISLSFSLLCSTFAEYLLGRWFCSYITCCHQFWFISFLFACFLWALVDTWHASCEEVVPQNYHDHKYQQGRVKLLHISMLWITRC